MLLVVGLAAMEKALGLMLLILLGGSLIIGVYEARKRRRGALGWIVSMVAAIIGGTAGGMAFGIVASEAGDAIKMYLAPSWVEADATLGLVGLLIGIYLGVRIALSFVNRFR